jgi:hypothetical protein
METLEGEGTVLFFSLAERKRSCAIEACSAHETQQGAVSPDTLSSIEGFLNVPSAWPLRVM